MTMDRKGLFAGLLALFFFIAGCASTEVKKGEEPKISAEKVQINEFILGSGDTVDITVYRNDDLHKALKIDPSGKIMFPLIGDVHAAGKSIFALRDEMTVRLSKYLVNPQVTINVSTVQSQKVMVLGQVNNPGVFTVDSDVTILEAVSKAGGPTMDAKLVNVLLIRPSKDRPDVIPVNLSAAFSGGTGFENKLIKSGDIIYVPEVVIADVSWYFTHLGKILSPVVNLESGIVLWPQVKSVLTGKSSSSTPLSIPATR